jgi:hypothetical protein
LLGALVALSSSSEARPNGRSFTGAVRRGATLLRQVPLFQPSPRYWERTLERIEMTPHYRDKDLREGVARLDDDAARAKYRLTFRGGRLYDRDGKLFDSRRARPPKGAPGPRAIFVIAPDGTLYAANDHAPGAFHHSTFLGGGPVAFAGDFEVINGVIKSVSNRTGHYETPERLFAQALRVFRGYGASTADLKLEPWRPPGAAREAAPAPHRPVSLTEVGELVERAIRRAASAETESPPPRPR